MVEIGKEISKEQASDAANEIFGILDRIPQLQYGMSVKEAAEYVTEHYVSCRVRHMDEREVAYGKLLKAAAVLRDRVEELDKEVSDLRKNRTRSQ